MQETYPHRAVSLVKPTLVQLDKLFLIFYKTPRNIRVGGVGGIAHVPYLVSLYAVHILNPDFLETQCSISTLPHTPCFPKMSLFDYPINFLERLQNREKPLFASTGMSVRPPATICCYL